MTMLRAIIRRYYAPSRLLPRRHYPRSHLLRYAPRRYSYFYYYQIHYAPSVFHFPGN